MKNGKRGGRSHVGGHIDPFVALLISALLFIIYFFLGQRFPELGTISKLTMCLAALGVFLRALGKGLSHFLIVAHAGIWTFISLTISFGKVYSGDSPIVFSIVMGPWLVFVVSLLTALGFSFANERMNGAESYPLLLFVLFGWVWLILAFHVSYFDDWVLENVINLGFLILLYLTYKWFRFSKLSYGLMFTFMVLNIIGSHYTYAEVPFGFWLKAFLGLDRNHYDRIVHFCFGFLMTYPTRELIRRVSDVKGFWGLYIPIEFVLALSAIYEIIEWLTAVVFGGDLGIAYLGTQGDNFDPIKDMALAGLGSVICTFIIFAVLMHYDRKQYWSEFRNSLHIDKTVLGEEALRKLQKR